MAREPIAGMVDRNVPSQLEMEDLEAEVELELPGSMDDDNLAALKASRSMKRGTADAEGRGTKVKFIRKFNTGKDWDSGAPIVQKSDGSTWDINSDGTIGNGSTVEVELSVYDTSRPNIVGTRLDKVKVLDHVVYVADTAGDEASPPPVVESEKQSEVLF